MARIVAASEVARHLQEAGWRPLGAPEGTVAFQRRDERIALALHPRRPDFVYLSDLAQRLSAVYDDLASAATEEPLETVAGFEILIDQGGASEDHLEALRSALDGLNRTLGGLGLQFEEVAVPGQVELSGDTEAEQMLRIRRFRAVPRTQGAVACEPAWRQTIATVAGRALPTIERRRRGVLEKLLERTPEPPLEPERERHQQQIVPAPA